MVKYYELLTELQYVDISHKKLQALVSHPRFKAWFRNSKVVDKDGWPMVCYHYSSTTNFKLFSPFSHFGTQEAALSRAEYVRVTDLNQGQTIQVLLSIQNPLEIPDLTVHNYENYRKYLISENIFRESDLPKITSDTNMLLLQKLLLKKGIDGFKYENLTEHSGSISWITLKPTQAMPLSQICKQ